MMKYLCNFLLMLFVLSTPDANANEQAQQELEQFVQQAKGQVVYIDFWASWCKPCRKSFPWMNEMKAKYEQQGLTIISVNLDAERSFADEFLKEIPANFPVIYDPNGTTARKLKVRGMPSSYLVNRAGQMVSSHKGFNAEKKAQFEQEIVQLLAETD